MKDYDDIVSNVCEDFDMDKSNGKLDNCSMEDEKMYRCKICGLVGLMLDMNYHFKKNDSKHPGKSEDWEEHVELIDDVTGKPKEESVDVKKLKAEPVKDEDKLIIKDTDTGKK